MVRHRQSPEKCEVATDGQLGRSGNRRMERAQLLGSHSHNTANGVRVHVYARDGRYLARGRFYGRPFGVTLGRVGKEAESTLRRLLTEIEDGKFRRRSESSAHSFGPPPIRALTLRELCDACLQEKRRLRGLKTAKTYEERLSHVLDFAERPDIVRRWRLARDIDRAFAIELRTFLIQRQVSRNGRAGGRKGPMSERGVRNVLETLRMALDWAARADVRNLPVEFMNPLTPEIIGHAPVKDPLRDIPLPLQERIAMLERMDDWQLLTLSVLLVLPLRPEDAARALISDFDLDHGTLRLGSHFGGIDFSKGKVDVTVPVPAELVDIFRLCIGRRTEGPLFVSRKHRQLSRRIRHVPASRDELLSWFIEALARRRGDEIQAPEDQKRVFVEFLHELGGISTGQIRKEIGKLLPTGHAARAYDLRHGVTQDMHDAGIRHLELRYLTGHTTTDILNEYVRLDPQCEMQKYFDRCRPLLERIGERTRRLVSDRRSVA
jgi:integrase